MSAPTPLPAGATALWTQGALEPRDDCDVVPATVLAADSWLVEAGAVRGLELHRERFAAAVPPDVVAPSELERFWAAAVARLPRTGAWFPRVELREQRSAPQLLLRMRAAPELRRSVVLATHRGPDPRTTPRVKGPDLEAMLRLRTAAQADGADEAVILDADGFVAEGTTTSLVWWRGDALCAVDRAIPRIASVTERTVLTLAAVLGVEVLEERVRPEELDGREVWALSALHGIRIVTAWHDGPAGVAEEPGRLARWRLRLDALRHPLDPPDDDIPENAPDAGEAG